jgi:light-regulated signal transduction histidine kinase (bacteriophytochrome)
VKAQEALDRSTRELARSNAALEQFAFGVAHDLQEPLRVIASYCDLLEKRYRGRLDDEAAPFFGHIGESVDRLQDLIRDLLAYARAGRGDEPRPTPAEEIIRQVVANLAELIRTEKAEIRRGDLPMVMGRPAELTQLFQNLIGNAIKFRGPDAPRVDITCERRGSTAAFAVRDNGIGMEPAEAGKIFEMFSRLHGREYPGTGIGLALCRKIVESLGGRIEVESTPGAGSTFRFELPLAEGSRAPRS